MTSHASHHARTIDLVVTRYKEPLRWLWPYLARPGWNTFIYNTGPSFPRVCSSPAATCKQIDNAGYEWHGYLTHILDRYSSLSHTVIFMQGDPLTVSPDAHCLLNQSSAFAPVQVFCLTIPPALVATHPTSPIRLLTTRPIPSPHATTLLTTYHSSHEPSKPYDHTPHTLHNNLPAPYKRLAHLPHPTTGALLGAAS